MGPELTAVFDSCVLYASALRDLLVQLSSTGLFRPRWSNRIHEEWMRAVLCNRPDLSRETLERTRRNMDLVAEDCLVTGYEHLIDAIRLPDQDDRHVVAAAMHTHADVIVTFNLKHFPADRLAPLGVHAEHPDAFIRHLHELSPGTVLGAARAIRRRLKHPPLSPLQYLECLKRQRLPMTCELLSHNLDLL